MAFLTVNNFFSVHFQKYQPKNICVSIVFKAESKKNILWGVFFKNQKRTFLGVQNGTFKKSNFKFVFVCLFFYVKGSFMQICIKIF